jgi:transcriptional regulator with XRE-family HTH domain
VAEVHPEDAKTLIRVLRVLRGWSQQQLAERAGVDESSVRRYEKGRPVPPPALVRLSQAAGVPERILYGVLLPVLHFLRVVIGGGPHTDRLSDPEFVEQEASWAATQVAEEVRTEFLIAWAKHVQEREEREANAWRPVPEHREEAIDLWQRLEPLTSSQRELMLAHGTTFHSWAIVERVADQAAREVTSAKAKALKLAEFAVRVASLVTGSEPWKARIRGYAIATLGKALWATGDREAAEEAFGEAERLWTVGNEEPGLLDEGRFREAMAGRS